MEFRSTPNNPADSQQKRALLMEALGHLQGFFGKIVVIKYGGAAMVQEEFKTSFAQDVVLLKSLGMRPVVVHGGGPEVTKAMKQYGQEATFVDGLRVTDLESLKISEMVLSGQVNKEIITHINAQGGLGVGLSGKDGKLITASKLEHPSADLGFVGRIERINPALIHSLIQQDYIPVISPIGMGEDGHSYNINADTAASHIAAALKAQKIIFLTDVHGVMKDNQLISSLSATETRVLIQEGVIHGGMKPKVEGMLHALDEGVQSAHIINGMEHHTLIAELFTKSGIGTMILANQR